MVPVDSSAAKMPRPGATMASATLFNPLRFIVLSKRRRRDSAACLTLFYALVAAEVSRTNSTSTPGRVLPSSDSKKAPPPVETWLHRPTAPRHIERRHGVAAPGKTDKLFRFGEFRHGFRHLDGSGVERFHLEGA